MNKKNAELWISRLESDPPRAHNGLACAEDDGPKFCALGHLCDIYIQETGQAYWAKTKNSKTLLFKPSSEETPVARAGYPSPEVWEWLGVNTESPDFRCTSGLTINGKSIAYYNDNTSLTFPEIAALIKKELDSQ